MDQNLFMWGFIVIRYFTFILHPNLGIKCVSCWYYEVVVK